MAMRRTKPARRAVPRRRFATRNAKPWTKEEIAFMRKFYRTYETAWIARQLGRSVYSVRYKAVDLNIKKASPSVWRGNRGASNAFRRFAPNRTSGTPRRRAKVTRRKTTRKYRATSTRRTPRRATSRRMSTRRNNRRR